MNLSELYESFSSNPDCRELLLQTHWLSSFVEFDPRTGDALPMSLGVALVRMTRRSPSAFVKDRLWHLMSHSEDAARRLMKALSEEPRRESTYLPIRQVRELDTASFIALSKRPGRNIREKLADKPYMQAVRHFQSIDVPENRLLKAYLLQLADVLEVRREYLKDKTVEDYLEAIYRWLKKDEVQTISRWENLAPNNALLSHRDYRRVWDSWRLLQTLDADIDRDMAELARRRQIKDEWEERARQYASGDVLFADMPLIVDFNAFSISSWDPCLPRMQGRFVKRDAAFYETDEPVCLDLTQIQPVFATTTEAGKLNDVFFWQRWSGDQEQVDLELYGSEVIYLHSDATTITCSDMFFFQGDTSEALLQASHSFVQRLRRHFHSGRLIWLAPDGLNEFELELVRRNINSAFSRAEPLPCSVAAVFEHIGYDEISCDGYRIAVVERINGKAYLTEMVARYDEDLREVLPESSGYIWEKGVTELFGNDIPADDVSGSAYLYKEGTWLREYNPYGVAHSSSGDVVMDEHEGYDRVIWLNTRPVSGGIRIYQLQKKAGDIPLWRNHIPELMTKVLLNGSYQSFYFVGKDVTVQPIRNKPIRIQVSQKFTLPKGKRTYRLPLLLGTNEEALEYEAKLISRDFPYAEDVECRLNMTYTYGADDPYKLVFEPLDSAYRQIQVIWQKVEDAEIDDASGPAYPTPLTWYELQHQTNLRTGGKSDFLEWVVRKTEELISRLYPRASESVIRKRIGQPQRAVIQWNSWGKNSDGSQYVLVKSTSGEHLIYSNNLLAPYTVEDCQQGAIVYCYERTGAGGKVQSRFVSLAPEVTIAARVHDEIRRFENKKSGWSDERSNDIVRMVHSALYVPYLHVWADGRSVSDFNCPQWFRERFDELSEKLVAASWDDEIPESVRRELLFLLTCCFVDLSQRGKELVEGYVSSNKASDKMLGIYLGSLTGETRSDIFRSIISRKLRDVRTDESIYTIVANAIWRQEGFIDVLDGQTIESLALGIESRLEEFSRKELSSLPKWKLPVCVRYLELLFGLLRSRDSSDRDISSILQPNRDLTKRLASIIETISAKAVAEHLSFASRVKLKIEGKPEDDRTPDLLYAVQLFLTGNASMNAIRVTGVVDDG